jgi:IS30 family transposase
MSAKVKMALRKRIKELLQAGSTQAAIALKLDKAPSTIAHHVRALGIAAKEYSSPSPLHRGKRRCIVCRKTKTVGAFPSKRDSTCTMCIRTKVQ